ncbi:Sodium/solute symporter superfamily [Sesbania bispinosa]|nr:Sodium/solute symporter superfamily [Sesbania bispinosa]
MNDSDIQPSYEDLNSYSIVTNGDRTIQVCFNKTVSHGSSLWAENTIDTTLPAFVLQFALVLSLNRIFIIAAESAHVPRPSAIGRWDSFAKTIFPYKTMLPLETVGALTLVYYVFLIGLEVELKPITRCYNKKAMVVAIAGTIFTLPIGVILYYFLITDMGKVPVSSSDNIKHIKGAILWGITLSCSSEFPEIAKILQDLKLLLTENGQLALTSSLVNDLFSFTLILLALTQFYYGSILSLIITLMFVLGCFFVFHPLAKWLINKIGKGDRDFVESQIIIVLHVVLVIGLFSDGLGAHSITGAFFLGVVIPKGALNNAIQDKVFDFVSAFTMPLFFVVVGERIHVQEFNDLNLQWITVVIVIVLAIIAKIVCIFAISWFYQMPLLEGLSLALLMNTKGTVPFVILSTGRDRLELDNQTFGVMLLSCWLMTAIVGPILATVTKTLSKRNVLGSKKRKSVQGTRPDSPLRVLACVHTKRDANVIINLLKASSPSVRSPIQVLAVELIKMTIRPTSSLIIRDARKPSFNSQCSKVDSFKKDNGGKDNLISFDNLSQAIFAEKLRIISDYNSMHKDILNLSRRRGVTLILTTLYKQPTYDGLGAGTATARAVNIINRDHTSKDEKKVVLENLVKEAPCCLAIFVDRGLGQKPDNNKEKRIAMFYIGGEDDREALSYAWRMSRNMEVQLTVVRLVWNSPDDEFDETDRVYLKEFLQQAKDTPRVRYLEKVVKDEKETVTLLNKIGNKGFDLYVIGRGHGRKMSLAQTVDPVLEEPALGPLGDALTDLNSTAETSILILQRQGEQHGGDDLGKHERSASAQLFDNVVEQQVMFPPAAYPPMVFSHYA